MLPCLVVISLAFTWLLYESDWLRIRLLVGALVAPTKTIRLYRHTKHDQVGFSKSDNTYLDRKVDTIFSACITEPICGWDWLLNRNHPLVEYRISIEAWGCKHSIHLCDNPNIDQGRIMKDVCKTAFAKPKNGHKPKRIVKRPATNPNYQLLKS